MIILFFPPLSNHKIQSSAVSPHLLKSSQVCKRLAGLKVSTLVQRSFELLHCQVKSAVLVSIKKYAVVITPIVKTIELGCYCFKCNAILYSMTCHLNKFPSSIHFMWSIYSIDVNIWNVKHTICYNTIYCIHTMACNWLKVQNALFTVQSGLKCIFLACRGVPFSAQMIYLMHLGTKMIQNKQSENNTCLKNTKLILTNESECWTLPNIKYQWPNGKPRNKQA